MLVISSHITNNHYTSIFYGLIAVACLGWPFIAVMYVPLGLDTLHASYNNAHATSQQGRYLAVLFSLIFALTIFAVLTFGTFLVDYYYYGTATNPNLNIFMYNAVGDTGGEDSGVDTGDELYGVEPFR